MLTKTASALEQSGFICSQIQSVVVKEKEIGSKIEEIRSSVGLIDLVITDFHAIDDFDTNDYSGFRIAIEQKRQGQPTIIYSSEDNPELTEKYGVVFISKNLKTEEFIAKVNNLLDSN